MKNYFKCLLMLTGWLMLSCNKEDNIPSAPVTERLLKEVALTYMSFSYEYNTDKTVQTINSNFDGEVGKFSLNYTNGRLTTLLAQHSSGYVSTIYTYDANNKIATFKKGSSAAITVEYLEDLNQYIWIKDDKTYTLKLNTAGDVEEFSRTYNDDGENITYHFVYNLSKKGPFTNSQSVIPQLMMFEESWGVLLAYAGGMNYKPLEFLGTQDIGIIFTNQYDTQDFLVKSTVDDAELAFEYY